MNTRAVWKFPIEVGATEVKMPRGAEVLHVGAQDELPMLWALVDVDAAPEVRRFVLLATGEPWRDDPSMVMIYQGTVLLFDGAFVGHIFEGVPVG